MNLASLHKDPQSTRISLSRKLLLLLSLNWGPYFPRAVKTSNCQSATSFFRPIAYWSENGLEQHGFCDYSNENCLLKYTYQHRAQIFQIFKRVRVKLHHISMNWMTCKELWVICCKSAVANFLISWLFSKWRHFDYFWKDSWKMSKRLRLS